MRKRLFEVIELSNGNDKKSRIYDLFMMCVITISLLPLAFKETNDLFRAIDYVTACIFIVDYILRFITADYKLGIRKENSKEYKQKFGGGGKTIYRISIYAYGDY